MGVFPGRGAAPGGPRVMEDTVEKKGALILVADDDADVCSILGMVLKRRGHKVVETYDGLETWRMILEERPDLVLLDIMMPGLTGIEVCRKIRETPEVAKTPVIMISALVERNEIVEGFEAGANDYITKPFITAEVLARVRSALRQWELRKERERGKELRSFEHQLDRILTELEQPAIQLMRYTKRLRDLTVNMSDEERKHGQMLYQHGMRAYLIVQELRSKKQEIRERLTERNR